MPEPEKKLEDVILSFVETARYGRPLTSEERLEQLEVQRQGRIERWREMTSWGSWLVWPVWAIGWLVGYVVFVAKGLWWNIKRGYKRTTTHPRMDEYDPG